MDAPPREQEESPGRGSKTRKSKPARSPKCLCCAVVGKPEPKKAKIGTSEDAHASPAHRIAKVARSADLYESSEDENSPDHEDDKVSPKLFFENIVNELKFKAKVDF